MPPVKKQPVEQFAGAIHAHQQEMVKQRKDVSDELVAHMLKMPGMAEIFSTEQSKQMLGQQLVNSIEFATRQNAEMAAQPPLIEAPPVEDNGGQTA